MSEIRSLYSEEEIAARIDAMAKEIAADLPKDFLLVGLLKGAFIFVADLARALSKHGAEPEIEFLRLSSYGLGKESAGEVHLLGDVPSNLAGRSILLVDDILDSGRSISYAKALLEQREVEVVKVAILLDKPSRRVVDQSGDYVGFEIEDLFVAGYGIDYAEKYRQLPYIGTVD